MKFAYNQLNLHLKQNLAPIYLVTGNEPLLVDEAAAAIRAAAKAKGFTTREVYYPESNFSWDDLSYHADSFSLFSNKSLLELRVNNKWPEPARTSLQRYVANLPTDKILLLLAEKLDANQLKARWLQDIDSVGVIVQVWPIDRASFPAWLKQRAQQLGLQVSSDGCQILADSCEGNLLAAVQELEKLHLLYFEGTVTAKQVADAISDNARFDVFSLVDTALSGDGARTYRILQNLQREGLEPVLILWGLTKELRLLVQLSSQIEQGTPLEKALQAAGVWKQRQALVKQALKRQPALAWRNLLLRANSIDRIIKGSLQGNAWLELIELALGFGGITAIRGNNT